MRYLVLDIETTGLKPPTAICELAFVEIDAELNELKSYYSLIDPEMPIEPGASGVHGITNKMVENAPTINEYLTLVAGNPFDEGDIVVVAHNAVFDLRLVGPLIPSLAGSICTLKLARRIYPDAPDFKLQTLRYMLELDISAADAHSAAGDVKVTVALLKRMSVDSGLDIEGLRKLSALPMNLVKMPFGAHKGTRLQELPASYVHWLLTKATIDDDLRAALTNL